MRFGEREHLARWGVFLTALGFYLWTGSRERPWADGNLIFEVAEALVYRHSIEIESDWAPMSRRGPDGGLYAPYSLLPSIVQVPAVLLLQWLGPAWRWFSLPMASQLAPSALAAGACVLFHALTRRLGGGLRVAFVTTAMLGVSTGLWAYARRPYAETLQVACVLGVLLTFVRLWEAPSGWRALVAGIVAGLAVNADVFLPVGIGLGTLVLFGELRRRGHVLGRPAAWFLVGAAPGLALMLAYNHARWGSAFVSGHPAWWLAGEHPLWGLVGLTVSPGRGLFLFEPLVILGLATSVRLYLGHRAFVSLAILTVVPTMLFHTTTQLWNGGWCWGPRVWLFAVPVMLLPIGIELERLRGASLARRRLGWGLAIGLAVAGTCIQGAGNAVFWDHYIRIARRVQRQWLGNANRRGAIFDDRGSGACDPCTEDLYGLVWMPALQPIVGHVWMLRHLGEADAADALQDAPWRRYTTLDLDLGRTLERTTVDWWGLLWLQQLPERRPAGIALSCAFTIMLLGGMGLCWTAARRVDAGS